MLGLFCRSIYQILIKIENYVRRIYKNRESIFEGKEFLRFERMNINRCLSMHRVRVDENEMMFIKVDLGEPFEAYVPPEGDGKATLMSKEVN